MSLGPEDIEQDGNCCTGFGGCRCCEAPDPRLVDGLRKRHRRKVFRVLGKLNKEEGTRRLAKKFPERQRVPLKDFERYMSRAFGLPHSLIWPLLELMEDKFIFYHNTSDGPMVTVRLAPVLEIDTQQQRNLENAAGLTVAG